MLWLRKPRTTDRSLRRAGALGAGLGLVCASLAAAPASADTGTLKYTCTASILTEQPFTAVIHGTAPQTATVGDTVAVSGFSGDVTVNADATSALYWYLGARSIDGTASQETSVDNAGTPAGQASVEMQVPSVPVPSSGELTVSASGTWPSFVTTTAGTVRFQVGNFTAALVAKNMFGGSVNVPVSCVLDAGQDPTVASVTVANPA